MDAQARKPAETVSVATLLMLIGGALLATLAGAVLSLGLWSGLPQAQVAKLQRSEIQARWQASLRNAPSVAREGVAIADAAGELAPAITPQARAAPQIGNALRNAMGAPSTQAGRLLVAAAILAQGESEGRTPEQVWGAIRPYLESGATAPYPHFAAARESLLRQAYAVPPVRAGTAAALAAIGPELLSPFLQFFVPRVRAIGQAWAAAGDPAGAELCGKVVRRLLREWVLEAGPPGTRLVAAELLMREMRGSEENAALVAALSAWRAAYLEPARQRGAAALGLGDVNLCPAEHAAVAGSVAASIWLLVSTLVAAIGGIGLAWKIFLNRGALRRAPILALGGLVGVAAIVACGVVLRSAGSAAVDDIRSLMDRAGRGKTTESKRSDVWLPVYRAQIVWAAAGWTTGALVAGVVAGAALHARNRLAGGAAVLLIAWALIAMSAAVVAGWGHSRLSRYETALADAYGKGVYAAVAGDSAEDLLAPIRAWRP
jgi:hypothetical protein